MVTAFFTNAPYALITTAVSADLVRIYLSVCSGPYSRAKEVLITQGIEHDVYRHNLFLRRNTVDVYNRPERLQSNLFGLGQLTNRHVLSTPDSLCIV